MTATSVEAPIHTIMSTIPEEMPYPNGSALVHQYRTLAEQFRGSDLTVEMYDPHPEATYYTYPDHRARPYTACRIGLPNAPKDGATLVLMAGMHLNELAGNSTLQHMTHLAATQPELLTNTGIAAVHCIDASPTSVDQQGNWIEGSTMPPLADYLLTMNRFDLEVPDKLIAGGDWAHEFRYGRVMNACIMASSLACKGVIDRSLRESDRVVVASLHNALVGGYGGNVAGFKEADVRLLNDLTAFINPDLGPAPQDECTKMNMKPIVDGWYEAITGKQLLAYEQSLEPDTAPELLAKTKAIKDTGIGYTLAAAERITGRTGRTMQVTGILTEPPTHATTAFSDLVTPSGLTLRESVMNGAEIASHTLRMAQDYAQTIAQTRNASHSLVRHIERLSALWLGDEVKKGSLARSIQQLEGEQGDRQLSNGETNYRAFMYSVFPLYTSGMAYRLALQLGDMQTAERFRSYVQDVTTLFEAKTKPVRMQKQELVRHQFAGILAASLALRNA